jgi:hypothetical protein
MVPLHQRTTVGAFLNCMVGGKKIMGATHISRAF